MNKRLFMALTVALLTAASLWAKDDEIIVTRQLTTGQRNSLPEKTIVVEMKHLAVNNKKADAELIDAITQVMDTIAAEDYQHRTFVMLLDPKADGEVSIAVHSDDIVTRGAKNQDIYWGELEHGRYHFVVLTSKDNMALLELTFKRHGKVKFVQEFEMVDFKTPNYPTNVIARWVPHKGLQWLTVIINDDPDNGQNSADTPALMRP